MVNGTTCSEEASRNKCGENCGGMIGAALEESSWSNSSTLDSTKRQSQLRLQGITATSAIAAAARSSGENSTSKARTTTSTKRKANHGAKNNDDKWNERGTTTQKVADTKGAVVPLQAEVVVEGRPIQQQQHVVEQPKKLVSSVEEEEEQAEARRRRAEGAAPKKWTTLLVLYCVTVSILSAVTGITVWAVMKRRERGSSSTESDTARDSSIGATAQPPTSTTNATTTTVVPTTAPAPSSSLGPNNNAPAPSPPCVPGRYYYTYDGGYQIEIGYVDLNDDLGNQHLSTPDCDLWYLAFDSEGTAYGECDFRDVFTLVTVDLLTGKTTEITEFPTLQHECLVYNPAGDHFFTAQWHDDNTWSSLVRIEKENWTFTAIEGSEMVGPMFKAFAIDSNNGNIAYGVNEETPASFYLVNLESGTYEEYLGKFPRNRDPASIAFHGSTLYGIGYELPAPLFAINVALEGKDEQDGTSTISSFTTTWIKNVNASRAEGGAFCPL